MRHRQPIFRSARSAQAPIPPLDRRSLGVVLAGLGSLAVIGVVAAVSLQLPARPGPHVISALDLPAAEIAQHVGNTPRWPDTLPAPSGVPAMSSLPASGALAPEQPPVTAPAGPAIRITVIAGAPAVRPPRRALQADITPLLAERSQRPPVPRPAVETAEPPVAAASLVASAPRPPLRPAELATRAAPATAEPARMAPAEHLPEQVLASALRSPGVLPGRSRELCNSRLSSAIPARPRNAQGGSAYLERLAQASGTARDRAITAEVLSGNLPDFLRELQPVTFSGQVAGNATQVTICVMPDYLALGSDRDFVRVPLGLDAAMQIAERFDMLLPTTRMVDAIHAQAGLRLAPQPMPPGPEMSSTPYFLRHNATVERQRSSAGARGATLVSGHKKDLVLTNRLAQMPGRVAIYGWHRPGGQPIQPLSTVHGAGYADYSHGVRLISRTAYVNGRAVDLRDLLADARLAGLVSDEGPVTGSRLLLAALSQR